MLLHLENFELRNRSKIQIPIGNAKKIKMPLIPLKPQFNRIQSIIIGFFFVEGRCLLNNQSIKIDVDFGNQFLYLLEIFTWFLCLAAIELCL